MSIKRLSRPETSCSALSFAVSYLPKTDNSDQSRAGNPQTREQFGFRRNKQINKVRTAHTAAKQLTKDKTQMVDGKKDSPPI
ncbi:hypothetical protein AVEN_135478-1 [Araneus ventricosus]|uniref:Uncharacterized protein n=1 Tax=Araneus ventricosus TaxID=182803 RepID=A0A4Y2BFH2_ARAVE|nr:hypothetical protein AVEN_135478-1 [Araneus ventricosus]